MESERDSAAFHFHLVYSLFESETMEQLEAQLDVGFPEVRCVTPRSIPALSTSGSWSENHITSASGGTISSQREIATAKSFSFRSVSFVGSVRDLSPCAGEASRQLQAVE